MQRQKQGKTKLSHISDEKKKLMQITKESLYKGIEQARPGNHIGDIGYAVQMHAESNGYSVVRELVGHGIGEECQEGVANSPSIETLSREPPTP